MWPSPIKLKELLQNAACNRISAGWLYLPKDWRTWSADTLAYVIDGDADFDFDRLDCEAEERGYAGTIDEHMLENVIYGVRGLLKLNSFEARLEGLIYYVRFDAMLPSFGAPDPPSSEETQHLLDRKFYDSIGPERTEVPCRVAGCDRGAVAFSTLCKAHHFEKITGRSCPFND